MREEVVKVAKFLNKSITEKQLTDLCKHLNFDNFSKNEATNFEMMAKGIGLNNPQGHFIRKTR